MSSANQDILTSLLGRIRERRGFTLVIGAVGIGKTTLLNALLDLLDVKVKVSVVFNIGGTFEELLHMILIDLGLADFKGTLSRVEAFERLKSFAIRQFANGGNVVLIVDEAQNLDNRSMENLRLLSNLETRKHKLIQIILCGQPDLEKKLRQPALRHLAQRITVKRHLCPLNKTETYKYLDHRLAVAGYTGSPLFNPKAREMVWKYSEGIPLNINRICHNALAAASALGQKRINSHIIDGVIEEIGWSPLPGTARPPPVNTSEKHHSNTTSITSYPLLAVVSLLSLSVGFVLGGPHFRDQYLGNLGTEISSRYKSFVARIIADPSHHETPAPSESLVSKAQVGLSKERPAWCKRHPES